MKDKSGIDRRLWQRKTIIEQVLSKQIRRTDAAAYLGISVRQLKRLLTRYQAQGIEGLIHKHCGRCSGRAYPQWYREEILSCYKEKYLGYSATLASEKLLELDGLVVHEETLRLWLKSAGLWHKNKDEVITHYSRRLRRGRYGELLQLDGSIHSWFEGEPQFQCLMNLVDDATGKTMALLAEGETTKAAFLLLRWWIINAGVPLSIYVDLKSLYVSPKEIKKK